MTHPRLGVLITGKSMTKFILFAQPGWRSFKLRREGTDLEKNFESIADALQFARSLPNSRGAAFLVLDDKGKDMATLTV